MTGKSRLTPEQSARIARDFEAMNRRPWLDRNGLVAVVVTASWVIAGALAVWIGG